MRRNEAIAVCTALATLALGACSTDTAAVTASNKPDAGLILSDTAGLPSAALSSALVSRVSSPILLSASTADKPVPVAYVSLPPGTFPTGVAATIQNRRTGASLTVAILNGGFDPVPVPAVSGDSLDIQIRMAGGGAPTTLVRPVPGKRPPRVVRTHPPRGKRDVALNTRILVVFSEPINVSTLTETSFELLQGTVRVAGQLAFADSAHLTAVFTPAAPLREDAEYHVIATQDIRDVDGEALETPLETEFRTVPTAATLSGRIAFATWSTISVINTDGTGRASVIDDDGQGWTYMSPAWSPDGSKIAFGSSRDGGWDIYVINADGSGLRRLTSHDARDDSPAWSPDGTTIAFTSNRDGDFEIHVMNVDGSGVRRVTDHPAEDGNPSWSPDGSKIAFTSDRDGGNEIYVINADGSDTRRLTNFPDPEEAIHPTWSPDGNFIAFNVVGVFHGVYVMTADGSGGVTRLTLGGGAPTWSPDGTRIVYAGGNLQIMNAGGGERRDLGVFGYEPAWSPVPR